MKKINITKLNIKKTIPRQTVKLICIDILFYFFITFGFYIFSLISYKFKIDPVSTSICWTLFFIPILILKIKKDLLNKRS